MQMFEAVQAILLGVMIPDCLLKKRLDLVAGSMDYRNGFYVLFVDGCFRNGLDH